MSSPVQAIIARLNSLEKLHTEESWTWGTVTGLSPLRVRLAHDDLPLNITPDSVVSNLSVGDRVRVHMDRRRVVIIGRAGGAPAPVVEDTGWISITNWRNGWSAYGSGFPAQYRIRDGVTEMRGLVKRSSNPGGDSVMFFLPDTARIETGLPERSWACATWTGSNGFGVASVKQDGSVVWKSGGYIWFSIDPLRYTARG